MLAFAGVLALTITSISLTLHAIVRSDATVRLDHELTQRSQALAAQISPGLFEDPSALDSLVALHSVADLADYPPLAVVRDPEGNVRATSIPFGSVDRLLTPAEAARVHGGEAFVTSVKMPDGERLRVWSNPLYDADGGLLGIVQVGGRSRAAGGSVSRFGSLLAAEGVAGLILGAMIAAAVVRNTFRPLSGVLAFAGRVETVRPGVKLRVEGPKDVRQLQETLNSMIGRFEESLTQRNEFMMSVSHELRTPLAALQGTADVLLLQPGQDPDVVSQLRTISAECGRLVRLSENLLWYGRSEMGSRTTMLRIEPVDLEDLVLDVTRQARALGSAARISVQIEEQIQVLADEDRLRQALLNLTDNALRHGQGRVTIGLRREPGEAVLWVRDEGPGVAEEHVERIFHRYFRSPGTTSSGWGLGLPVVASVAEAHAGYARVVRNNGRLNEFQVRLPLDAGT